MRSECWGEEVDQATIVAGASLPRSRTALLLLERTQHRQQPQFRQHRDKDFPCRSTITGNVEDAPDETCHENGLQIPTSNS